MLNQNFTSQPYPYIPPQYFNSLRGMAVLPVQTPTSPTTLILLVEVLGYPSLTGIGYQFYSFDGTTGDYIANLGFDAGVFFASYMIQSRTGNTYWVSSGIAGSFFQPMSPSNPTNNGPQTPSTFFGISVNFNLIAIDENADVFMNSASAPGNTLDIYQLSTGKYYYTFNFGDDVVAICLQNNNCAYVLLRNRVLVLIDYVHSTVLGAVRVPPSLLSPTYFFELTGGGAANNLCLLWDATYARLLLCQQVPDVGGANVSTIIGYSMTPVPTRLTTPIPLQSPETNESISVMTALVDDINAGMGGALVAATIASGPATVSGVGYTDPNGRALIKVLCGDTAGTVAIDCTVNLDPTS